MELKVTCACWCFVSHTHPIIDVQPLQLVDWNKASNFMYVGRPNWSLIQSYEVTRKCTKDGGEIKNHFWKESLLWSFCR